MPKKINKCPFCIEEGKKSKLFPGSTMKTAMGGEPAYYDEEGKFHWHDPNQMKTFYSCSNGHRFYHIHYNECENCDYNKQKEKIEKQEPVKKQWTAK